MPMRRRLLAYESISSLAIESVGRVPRTALPAAGAAAPGLRPALTGLASPTATPSTPRSGGGALVLST